ncbi:MAG TPA: ATP-binding cassette domain-containing protein [Woeseiaceae bacterium]|nr:ATP-binding cassette domain-containing protein [Woeseiaceae bacterium]
MIKIDGLTKRYGQHTVVDQLSFECAPGEILGFLGPNGAGKSTTMKMVTGFVAPSSGRASVCGHDIGTDALAARRKMGYLPEGAPCYPEMTPRSFLEFIADIRELSGDRRKQRLDEVIGRLHLEPVLGQSIDTLSKGFKRRVGLAQAILHDPEVLILDEPTDGLDPNQKHEVRQLIQSMARDKLIVISTHILEEVEAVCSRAIIISAGRILADDTPHNLAAQSRYHNAVRLGAPDAASIGAIEAAIARLPSVGTTETDRHHLTITALARSGGKDGEVLRQVSQLIAEKGWNVTGLQLESGRLDEVFRQITGGARA